MQEEIRIAIKCEEHRKKDKKKKTTITDKEAQKQY